MGVLGGFWLGIPTSIALSCNRAKRANQELEADYKNKALRDQIVEPFGEVNGLVFVPAKKFDENFTFTVTDAETNKEFVLSPSQRRVNV